MLRPRIIPCLLISGDELIKTVKFKYHKYIGDPINTLRIFNEKEVDELIFLDIEASKRNREPNYGLIRDLASECFMPISYGGGIQNVSQIEKILKIGIEKVSINSALLQQEHLAAQAAKEFGSSSIIGSIDVNKTIWGHKRVYSHAKRKTLNIDPIDYALKLEQAGVGEILLNHVYLDGTLKGYDLELIRKFSSRLSVPLVACGGASGYENLGEVIECGASASAGSIFVFQGPHQAVLISYPDETQRNNIVGKRKS